MASPAPRPFGSIAPMNQRRLCKGMRGAQGDNAACERLVQASKHPAVQAHVCANVLLGLQPPHPVFNSPSKGFGVQAWCLCTPTRSSAGCLSPNEAFNEHTQTPPAHCDVGGTEDGDTRTVPPPRPVGGLSTDTLISPMGPQIALLGWESTWRGAKGRGEESLEGLWWGGLQGPCPIPVASRRRWHPRKLSRSGFLCRDRHLLGTRSRL